MSRNFLLRKEFIEHTRISEKVLKEWETLKIIKPSGMTEDQTPFYRQELIDHANNIKKFIDMGYHPEEIQKILKKVGPPKVSDTTDKMGTAKNHLTVGGLAYRVGISTRTIKHWEDEGIIEPDMRSEGGFRLYSEAYVYLCNLIKDLQLFGYSLKEIKTVSDLFRTFLAINDNINAYSPEDTERKLETMCREIDRLTDKMSLLKEGIQRWEDLIGKKKKEITNLKKKNQKRNNEQHVREKTGEK
jgi:MerR family copper efflux transcriptional regulator